MLYVNLFIEKIMKKNKIWNSLELFGTEIQRENFIASIEDSIIGIKINNGSSIIYFNKVDVNMFNDVLKENDIDRWEWSNVEEENWVQKGKDFFKSIIISDKVQIIPAWDQANPKYTSIKINPALAFGTGHHETTSMMIEAMLRFDLQNKTVFDIGAGSGILSILARKLGSKNIYAIDNDDLTYNNFHENLILNDVDNIKFDIKSCFDIDNFSYDFIFANINLNVLIELIPSINVKGTIMFISGILDKDRPQLVSVLENHDITLKDIHKKKEWLCLTVEL